MQEILNKIGKEIDTLLEDKTALVKSLREQAKQFTKEKKLTEYKEIKENIRVLSSEISKTSNSTFEKRLAEHSIPKSKLKDNTLYAGYSGRCGEEMVWFSDKKRFGYWRSKFGDTFTDYVEHFEDDIGYVIFFPIKEASLTSENKKLREDIVNGHK